MRRIGDTSHRTFYVTDVEDIGDKGRENSMSLARGVNEEHQEHGIRALVLGSYSVNMRAAKNRMSSLFRDKVPIFLVHGDKCVSSLRISRRKGEKMWEMHLGHLLRNEVEQSPVKNRIQKFNERRRADNAWSCDLPLSFISRRINCLLGVHHSKFALMFCENHLRIAITTQNLKNGYTTDCCWFSKRIPLRKSGSSKTTSDWCNALSHYMNRTDEELLQTAKHDPDTLPKGLQETDNVPMTLRDFICRNRPSLILNKESETFWKDLFENFYFDELDQEGPYLVCSVPGVTPMVFDEKKDPLYGCASRRVGYLLRKLRRRREKLNETCSCQSDDIMIQPTSISSQIHSQYLWTELMMNYSAGVMPDTPRLIWPSEKFSRNCKQGRNVAFFHPCAFVELGRDGAQDAFCHYDIADGWKETRDKRMPHMKCMFRMLSSEKNACREFEWIYIGSMCLSRGAQGALTCAQHNQNYNCSCNPNLMKRVFRIRNFEMGVLFHSRSNRRLVAVETQWPKCEDDFTEFPMPFKIVPRKYNLNRRHPRQGDLPYFSEKGDAFQHYFAPDFNPGEEKDKVKKTNKLCICFQRGTCYRGASCRYVHGYKELCDGTIRLRRIEDYEKEFDVGSVDEEEEKEKKENVSLKDRRLQDYKKKLNVGSVKEEKEKEENISLKERRLSFDNMVFIALRRKLKRRKISP